MSTTKETLRAVLSEAPDFVGLGETLKEHGIPYTSHFNDPPLPPLVYVVEEGGKRFTLVTERWVEVKGADDHEDIINGIAIVG